MCTTSTPGGRVSQLRFGAADFISTRPLLAGLTKIGSFLQFESPAALVDSLLRGRYDTALVPAIEYLASELGTQGMHVTLSHDLHIERLSRPGGEVIE